MNLAEIISTTRDWLNLGEDVYPDSVVTSWVRMAEEFLSEGIRCKHMIQWDEAILTSDNMVELPKDWLELDLVMIPDKRPLEYASQYEFYDPDLYNDGRYTIVGNFIVVKPIETTGTHVRIAYYQQIPPVGNEEGQHSWLFDVYPRLGTLAVLMTAGMYAIEDARTPMWEKNVMDQATLINARHQESKSRGSKLISRQQPSWRNSHAKSRTSWRNSGT
jgi:hypothetical protein